LVKEIILDYSGGSNVNIIVLIIRRQDVQNKGQKMEKGKHCSKRMEDATLLALRVKERSMSHRVQDVSRH
jgi:hypothetical protein